MTHTTIELASYALEERGLQVADNQQDWLLYRLEFEGILTNVLVIDYGLDQQCLEFQFELAIPCGVSADCLEADVMLDGEGYCWVRKGIERSWLVYCFAWQIGDVNVLFHFDGVFQQCLAVAIGTAFPRFWKYGWPEA